MLCDSSIEEVASYLEYPNCTPTCNPICRSTIRVTENLILALAQHLSNPMSHFADEKGYILRISWTARIADEQFTDYTLL